MLKDVVLKALSDDKFDTKLSDLMRPILSFNESDSVYQIWEKMLEKREHISVIVDEYGCFRGVVSMEDVIETMTGVEIVDEDDVAVDMQAFAKEKLRMMRAEIH
ncbi:MAG: CBS domain-containing protein [Hallella sp.]|nr:CBS domain-containing protein [Hallella sp.]